MAKSKSRQTVVARLEKVFGMPFSDLINKNFKEGDSRYYLQKKLLEMIVEYDLISEAEKVFSKKVGEEVVQFTKGKWDPSKWTYDKFGAVSKESNPAFRPSALYHAIKEYKAAGEINFDFHISNKGRKAEGEQTASSIVVELTCQHCGKRHRNNGMREPDNLGLKIYQCPSCNMFGKCVAKISNSGIVSYKAVIKLDGIRQEVYVNSPDDLTMVKENCSNSEQKIKEVNERIDETPGFTKENADILNESQQETTEQNEAESNEVSLEDTEKVNADSV